jgi:flagellar L-ring protein precursor FlgH
MKKTLALTLICSLALVTLLAGCSTTPPPTIVQEPTSSRPRPSASPLSTNGAIYSVGTYRPMFEDRRARMVGDIMTIAISENTSAVKANGNSSSKSGAASFAAPTVLGLPAVTTAKLGVSTTSGSKSEEKAAASASNSFTGTIGVTVIDVLPNGYLVVSGEKQISFDKGAEYVRFSGTINPDMIQTGNTIASTQVADARVEYRTNSRIDRSEMSSLLTRFFLSLVPL